VSNRQGIVYLYAINSSDEDFELAVPTVKIYPFEEIKVKEMNEEEIEEDNKTRIEKILNLLRLDHLNEEEKISVTSLVTKHAEKFHLPGKAYVRLAY